jgi:SnoaL-like domain
MEIVRSFIAIWNKHDINATMGLLDPDIVFQSPLFSDPVRGIKARNEVNANFMTSMPDFEYRLLRIASEGDYVAGGTSWDWNLNWSGEASWARPDPTNWPACRVPDGRVFPRDS